MNKQKIKTCEQIGEFFLEHFEGDYAKTEAYLVSMGIKEIYPLIGEVIVVLNRPGLIIGKKGALFEGLRLHLGCEIKVIEFEGDDIYNHLVPYEYSEY